LSRQGADTGDSTNLCLVHEPGIIRSDELGYLAAVESSAVSNAGMPGHGAWHVQVGRIQILVISRDQVARDRHLGCIGDQNAFEVCVCDGESANYNGSKPRMVEAVNKGRNNIIRITHSYFFLV
jgi:hypothetical protein